MVRELNSTCKFCGQSMIVEISDTELKIAAGMADYKGMPEMQIAVELAKAKALKQCNCEGAAKARKQELRRNFEGFVAGDLVNFMDLHKLEEIQVTDKHGNKAKLKKKDAGIDVTKTLKDMM